MMEIQNMTATCCLNEEIRLPPALPGVQYNPQKFSGAIWKHGGLTFLIFRTGKVVCVGGKHVSDVRKGLSDLSEMLGDQMSDFKVVNFVGSTSLGRRINLRCLYNLLKSNFSVSYEPELFAGLVVKMRSVTVLCFESGKLIMTGVKSEELFEETLKMMKRYVFSC